MSQMVELLESFPLTDGGSTESRLEGVRFFKLTHPIPRKPIVYEPGICIIAQGRKIGYLGGQMFQYDANNYLVTGNHAVRMRNLCKLGGTLARPLHQC